MKRIRGQAELIYRDGTFYLAVVVDVPEPPSGSPDDWLGIDLGIINITTDSDGDTYSGAHLNGLRKRHAKLRTRLQAKGTNRKAQRRVPHIWGLFHQLRSFIEYKARLAGVPVVLVDPRNTSRTCPACGHVAKANYAGRVSLRRVRLRWAGRRHRCGEHPQGRPYAVVRGGPTGLAARP